MDFIVSQFHRATDGLDRWFCVSKRGSTLTTELRAGLATFLTMSYVLLVNPHLLGIAGLPVQAVMSVTALTSCMSTLFIGLFVNLPIGAAPSVTFSSFLVYTAIKSQGLTSQATLACGVVAAVIVAALTVLRTIDFLVSWMPTSVKVANVVGTGLLLAFTGLQLCGILVFQDLEHSNTMKLAIGSPLQAEFLVVAAGLIITATLAHRKVGGAFLLGIIITGFMYFIASRTLPDAVALWPTLMTFPLDFKPIMALRPGAVLTVVFFVFTHIFQTAGVLYGMSHISDVVPDGEVTGCVQTYLITTSCSVLGGFLGTTPIVVSHESAVGIKEGGRTGLTAFTVSACFGLCLFFAPILQSIPQIITAPALVLAGGMMLKEARHVDWEPMTSAVPAFVTIIFQAFTNSVCNGLYAGLITWVILSFTTGEIMTRAKVALYHYVQSWGVAPPATTSSDPEVGPKGSKGTDSSSSPTSDPRSSLESMQAYAADGDKYDVKHHMKSALSDGKQSGLKNKNSQEYTIRLRKSSSITQFATPFHNPLYSVDSVRPGGIGPVSPGAGQSQAPGGGSQPEPRRGSPAANRPHAHGHTRHGHQQNYNVGSNDYRIGVGILDTMPPIPPRRPRS